MDEKKLKENRFYLSRRLIGVGILWFGICSKFGYWSPTLSEERSIIHFDNLTFASYIWMGIGLFK